MNLKDQNNPAVLNAIKEIMTKSRQEAAAEQQKIAEASASKYTSFTKTNTYKGDLSEALVGNQHKIDKNKNNKIDAEDFKLLKGKKEKEEKEEKGETEMKEARFEKGEDVGEPGKNFAKIAKKAAAKYGSKEAGQRVAGAVLKKVLAKEGTDTPGNSYEHQCAIHVKHTKLGEGKTLFSQHAEPDESGNIAWYDVMFAEGIEKKVPTSELEILVSESHGNHKKKK